MAGILIVDDMPIFREPIEAVLRGEGFETATASDGREALLAMAAGRPVLVLLDLGMPVIDGISFLKIIRADDRFKSTPVLVLSAETDRARIEEAVRLGISGYLLKSGFSLKLMLERVRAALAARSAPSPPPHPRAARAAPKPVPEGAPATSPVATLAASPPAKRGPQLPRPGAPLPGSASDSGNLAAEDYRALKPILTKAELLDRLKACEDLQGFSPTVTQVLKLTANPLSSLDAVSRAIRQDQAMALKILKVANSSVYSRGDRVDNVQKAILRIGMQSIRQVVLNIGVVERFSSPAFREHISTAQFWEHSIACGIIAAELAHAADGREADSAFTGGLLHDLGRVVFAETLGDRYIHVIETARRLQAPLELVESRMLLLNHADVMDRLLSAWKFPKHLVDPIMHHHLSPGNVRSVASKMATEIIRLGLADRLAHAMLLGHSGNETVYPTEEHCRVLGVTPATILAIEDSARQQTADTKLALLSHAGSHAWPLRADQIRATIAAPFRPMYLSAAPEFDAHRIFCAELAGPRGDEKPNLVVMHIASPREREQLLQRLEVQEREAGLRGLPLLMLTPPAQAVPDSVLPPGRLCRSLNTPVGVSAFIAAAGALVSGQAA